MFWKDESLEDKEFRFFYIIQWIIFVASIAKGTAIGFITYKLNLSAMQIAIFASISNLGALGTYMISPYLRKNSRSLELFFIYTQVLSMVCTIIGLAYSIFCYFNNITGDFYIWLIINFFICISIYLEPTARSVYVKKRYPNFDFTSIIKSDVMTMGFAKIMGFSAGIFIISYGAVIFVFLLNLIVVLCFWFYLINELKKRPFRKINKIKTSEENNYLIKINNLDFKTTILLLILNGSFFTALNSQSVTYSNIWNIPFYLFSLFFAIGNIFFSLFVNKEIDITLKKGFNKYIYLMSFGYLLIYILDGYFILIGFFVLGGVGSAMQIYSNARLYSSKEGQIPKVISLYYLLYNIIFAISVLILGFLMQSYEIKKLFLFFCVLTPILMVLIKRRELKLQKILTTAFN